MKNKMIMIKEIAKYVKSIKFKRGVFALLGGATSFCFLRKFYLVALERPYVVLFGKHYNIPTFIRKIFRGIYYLCNESPIKDINEDDLIENHMDC